MSDNRHLMTVWNPSYGDDIMDQHIAVLLEQGEKLKSGEAAIGDVYTWWAKVRSPRRRESLPHLTDILALQEQIDSGAETHLYLTDFQSLYVGWLDRLTEENILLDEGEKENIPSYYFNGKWPIDFWLRLKDIRCIVQDDTLSTNDELRKLLNLRYEKNPVSIYGGILETPLIVQRKRPRSWFAGRDELTNERLWAEFDSDIRGPTATVAKELRDNLFGRMLWSRLEPESQRFLAAGEAVFRTHKNDPSFDFSVPLVECCKTVETELNALLFPPIREKLKDEPPAKRIVPGNEKYEIDLGGEVRHQTLGSIHYLLKDSEFFKKAVRTAIGSGSTWILEQLPDRLAGLKQIRNPGAHKRSFNLEEVDAHRNEILGIGCEGLIVEILRAKMRVNRSD